MLFNLGEKVRCVSLMNGDLIFYDHDGDIIGEYKDVSWQAYSIVAEIVADTRDWILSPARPSIGWHATRRGVSND